MSSGFISETEIETKRKLRQEEWERVRKPDEPLEAPPEEPLDNRSLFDRLKEQKDKKQEEFEEAHKLKNLVKVLDDDEVDFLDFVDRARLEEERRKRTEELQALSSFRNEVSSLREEMLQKHILNEIGLGTSTKPKPKKEEISIGIGTSRTSQTKLLAGIVKRKASSSEKDKSAEPPNKVPAVNISETKTATEAPSNDSPNSSNSSIDDKASSEPSIKSVPYKGNLVCIGVLPGLADYSNSSDSDEDILGNVDKDSSDSDEEPSPTRDLCGRRIVEVDKDK